MAKPRVFVSSTYYDLRHIRASLENFIESLGFEPVLFERGDIPFTHEAALDQSCYREVGTADIFVLVIGGRYGSAASTQEKKREREFFEKYDSVTKQEHAAAVARDIPVYVLVEAAVHAEYQTYLRNRDKTDIVYAHVDSVNIFELLAAIFDQGRNNLVHTFERFSDIENWLREQWAGRFREFLHQQSEQRQLSALSDQVASLEEANKTLATYLETILTQLSLKSDDTDAVNSLIRHEKARLKYAEEMRTLKSLPQFLALQDAVIIQASVLADTLRTCDSYEALVTTLHRRSPRRPDKLHIENHLDNINAAREVLGKPPLTIPSDSVPSNSAPRTSSPSTSESSTPEPCSSMDSSPPASSDTSDPSASSPD